MKPSRLRIQFLLLFIDIVLYFISIYVTLSVRYFSLASYDAFIIHIIYFIPLFIFQLVFFYLLNLYSLNYSYDFKTIVKKISLVSIVILFSGFAFFYLYSATIIFPKTILLLYTFFNSFFLLLWRRIFYKYTINSIRKPKIIFLGKSSSLPSLLNVFEENAYFNFEVITQYTTEKTDQDTYFPVTSSSKDLISTGNQQICYIYSDSLKIDNELKQFIYNEIAKGSVFYTYEDFYELIARKIPIESITDTWLIKNFQLGEKKIFFLLKRFFDILLSLLGLLLFIPFWPFILLLIKIDSKGPALYTQLRQGKDAKTFTIYKFRTMRLNNSEQPTTLNDTRITLVGRFLRNTRIDEIPQLINVLKGDLSLIGPRPERPELAEKLKLEVPYYQQRLLVRPGITGWDQVSGEYHSPSKEDTLKKLQSDLYYIKNASIILDISILLKTIYTVLKRSGR